MTFYALFGALAGGLFRLAPELMRLIDDHLDRLHELAMLRLSLERDRLQAKMKLAEIAAEQHLIMNAAGVEGMLGGVRETVQRTGIPWVDAFAAIVRPAVTFWWMGLFTAVKVAQLGWLFCTADLSLPQTFTAAWGDVEMAMLGGILNFWFLDRVIAKRAG